MAKTPPTPVTRRDPMVEHLSRLVGKKIIGLAVTDEVPNYDTLYGLRLSGGLIAWIQCDPEGNGPGFLSIEQDAQAEREPVLVPEGGPGR